MNPTAQGPAPRSILFCGGTPFACAMISIFGFVEQVGSWLEPTEHLVHPDDADLVKELLEEDGIKFSTYPEYLKDAINRA